MKNKLLRSTLSIVSALLVVFLGVMILGIGPGIFLIWLDARQNGGISDGEPGIGLIMIFTTLVATLLGIAASVMLTALFKRKLTP